MKKLPIIGGAIPRDQWIARTASTDPWPRATLVVDKREPLPTLADALLYAVSAGALGVFCFFVLGL